MNQILMFAVRGKIRSGTVVLTRHYGLLSHQFRNLSGSDGNSQIEVALLGSVVGHGAAVKAAVTWVQHKRVRKLRLKSVLAICFPRDLDDDSDDHSCDHQKEKQPRPEALDLF